MTSLRSLEETQKLRPHPEPLSTQWRGGLQHGISTLGFIGRIGFAPGTWGSLASLILWAPLVLGGVSFWVHLLVALAVFALGCWCIKGDDDAPEIVIDEAAGMGFATLFCMPTLASIAIAFVLFRVFDILKPWPISLADRSIKGPFGIMFDDVLAGGMAVVVTRVIGTLPI